MQGKIFNQFEGKTLDNFEPKYEDQEEALRIVREWMDEPFSSQGLTIVGPPGVGKTFLACMACKYNIEQGIRTECIEMSSYVDMFKNEFRLSRMIQSGKDDRDDEYNALTKRLKYIKMGARLLLLDDVGREFESESGWSNQVLFDLMRFRYNRGKATIITSNWPVKELGVRYGVGFSSFLLEA